ncbi:hypothetical protein [Mycobacterium sp. DL592]|uniref:hypothetical protein n=1 Tax=Mycobacterium sp. DL592 TaxID=2675524 RepID=UPI001FB91EFD|nr:hypothetical protein [Mycobacterium sp. DL592]
MKLLHSTFRLSPRPPRGHHHHDPAPAFRLTDRLHEGRTVTVTVNEISATLSGWLSELGVHSPLADDLASALRGGDWAAAHAIAENLSVEVTAAP